MSSHDHVVIGGCGFLGSHIVENLVARGLNVLVLDHNIRDLGFSCEVIECDITDQNSLREHLEGAQCVYHLAALSDLNTCLNAPKLAFEINVVGLINVLDLCVEFGVVSFVYASSIYAVSHHGSFYGISKRVGEDLVREYSIRYGLKTHILRYGSLYGPRSDRNNGIYRILYKAITTGLIEYNGNPETVREYIHVSDAARMTVEQSFNTSLSSVSVLTGQEPMRVKDLLYFIGEIMNITHENVRFNESEYVGHYVRTPYSIEVVGVHAHKIVPSHYVDLGQGIVETILWIKENEEVFEK